MWMQARLIVLTLLVTGLIWFYADQAIKETGTLTVQLELPSLSQVDANITSPPDRAIELSISGAAKNLARAMGELDKQQTITLNPPTTEPGSHTIELLPLVQQDGFLAKYRLTLNSISPPQAEVFMDKIVTRKMKIEADTPVGVEFIREPVFDPEFVALRYPSLRDKDLPSGDVIIISMAKFTNSAPGTPVELTIPVPLPLDGASITLEPPSTTLRMTLKKRLVDKELEDSISVEVKMSASQVGHYTVEFKGGIADEFIKPTLTGPPEVMAMLRPNQVSAYIEVTVEDIEASKGSEDWRETAVKFDLPSPDISLKPGTEHPREFRVRPVE
jgi:hypothetical protein